MAEIWKKGEIITFGHYPQSEADRVEGLKIPNLQRLGLANLRNLHGVPAAPEPESLRFWRKMQGCTSF